MGGHCDLLTDPYSGVVMALVLQELVLVVGFAGAVESESEVAGDRMAVKGIFCTDAVGVVSPCLAVVPSEYRRLSNSNAGSTVSACI